MTQFLIRTFIKNRENTANREVRAAYGNMACVVCVVCNVLLFLGKFLVGTLFGSVAIAADGLNNLSDASSNVVSLVGFKLGSRPADSEHPYGHARYEYLAGLAVSVMIMVIGVELLKESFLKVLHPTSVLFGWLTVAVLLASIAVKLWMSGFNKTVGSIIQSETLLATAADARNDVIATSAVLVASVITHFTGFDRLDGVMGLFGSESAGLNMHFGKMTATYTVDSKGNMKKVDMAFSASMKMDMPLEDDLTVSMSAEYDYDMTMTVNATGKAVKITFPDFSGYLEMDPSQMAGVAA